MEKVILEQLSISASQTEEIASCFAKELCSKEARGTFVAMFGDLGTGKTAFVRGFCSAICPNARVFSPTFAIINEYRGGPFPVFHFDVYRISDDDDLYSTGFYEYLEREEGVILCEWCENIPFALPEERYEIHIEKTDPENFPDRRLIRISEHK